MLSIDTNLLFHALNEDCPSHAAAYGWLSTLHDDAEVAVSKLILAELYGLMRNRAMLLKLTNNGLVS